MTSESVSMKNAATSSEPADFLLFKQFSLLKTLLTLGRIETTEDAILFKVFVWLIDVLIQSATNVAKKISKG